MIKIAYHPTTNKFLHIDNAENGLACNCVCWKCNERLEAKQGEIREKHFSHHTNLNCEGSQETALHEQAKQILVNNLQLNVPEHGRVTYSNPVAEKILEQFRPDVSATYDGMPIYFEVFVSHAVDSGKEMFFKLGKYRSLEIDLSNCTTTSFDEIKKLVLEEINNKKVFHWPKQIAEQDNDLFSQILDFISRNWKVILIAIGLYKFVQYKFRQRKKETFRRRK